MFCTIALRRDFLYLLISSRWNSLSRDILKDESRKVTLNFKKNEKKRGKKESREDRAKCKRLRLRVNRAKKIPRWQTPSQVSLFLKAQMLLLHIFGIKVNSILYIISKHLCKFNFTQEFLHHLSPNDLQNLLAIIKRETIR